MKKIKRAKRDNSRVIIVVVSLIMAAALGLTIWQQAAHH